MRLTSCMPSAMATLNSYSKGTCWKNANLATSLARWLLDGAERAASAVARTDVTLVPLNRRRFLFLVQETPTFAVQAMTRLAERVRSYNKALPRNRG